MINRYLGNVEVSDDSSSEVQRVFVVDGVVVGHAGLGAVKVGAAKLLGGYFFASRSLEKKQKLQIIHLVSFEILENG